MRVLLLIVRIYIWVLFAWALSSWFRGFAGFPAPIGYALDFLAKPVHFLFGWVRIGLIGFEAVAAIVLLSFLETYLKRKLDASSAKATPPPAPERDADV